MLVNYSKAVLLMILFVVVFVLSLGILLLTAFGVLVSFDQMTLKIGCEKEGGEFRAFEGCECPVEGQLYDEYQGICRHSTQ